MSKIVGIIGGVGPYAGLDFHKKILDCTPAKSDQEHLEIYHISASAKIEDRSKFLQGKSLANPAEGLIYAAEKLVAIGAEILVIPCNTAHSDPILSPFLEFIAKKNALFLNLLEETCRYIRSKGLQKVGLLATLGTYQSGVYQFYFRQIGCGELICPTESQKQIVSDAIYNPEKGIKSGAQTGWASSQLDLVVQSLQNQGAQAVIMGCTEIPLALGNSDFLLDPGQILAKRVVQAAL